MCDVGHPHHHKHHCIGRRDTRIRDPHHEDPVNYASRTDWQKALHKSKIDPDSKRYIKQLENLVTDNWEVTFDGLWEKLEGTLNQGLPITDDVIAEYLAESTRKQLRNLDRSQWDSAFNGLFVGAREQAYKYTGFGDKKRRAQVVDTLEEQAVLARLRNTALEKVKTITNEELRAAILEKLSEPGAYAQNPTQMANQIIREERRKLTEQTEDRATLKQQIKDLYDNQLWKIQRITRTESANAYWLSQLTGYKEQGITQIKFNSHTYEQRTCPICLALDGTTHDIDELLSAGGRYPLSTLTHPQCLDQDTLVWTQTGTKRIADIEVGEKVFTHMGALKRVLMKNVYHKEHAHNADEDVYRLNGQVVTATHQVYIETPSGMREWKRVCDLDPEKDSLLSLGVDTVVCLLCGQEMKQVTAAHLDRVHDTTCADYQRRFPDTPMMPLKRKIRNSKSALSQMETFYAEATSQEVKERVSAANSAVRSAIQNGDWTHLGLSGELNPAKRPESRKKISEKKMGEQNWMWGNSEQARINRSKGRNVFPKSDTKPERMVEALLISLGSKYEKQMLLDDLTGHHKYHRCDFVVPDKKVIIEADGCFWHGCPEHFPHDPMQRRPKDTAFNKAATSAEWRVIRIRECASEDSVRETLAEALR